MSDSVHPASPQDDKSEKALSHSPELDSVTLSPQDAAILDSLLEMGYSPVHLAGAQTEPGTAGAAIDPTRRQRVEGWLKTLATHPVAAAPENLVARTLAAASSDLYVRPAAEASPGSAVAKRTYSFPRRVIELAAMGIAAAVLLMVLIPGIGNARENARKIACANNLGTVGKSFAAYAADSSNALPSLVSANGASWKPLEPDAATPTEHSNTANLLPLVRGQYLTEAQRLTCPAAAAAIPASWSPAKNDLPDSMRGYSYTSQYGRRKPTWDRRTSTVILADRNPIFSGRGCCSIHDNSPNHAGNATMILYADASVRRQSSPDIGDDNIWTVASNPTASLALYTYTEAPADLSDTFLAP